MPPDRERDLERELQELGHRLDYPPTPDLANTVRQRLEEDDGEPTARRGWATVLSSRWAAAAAVLVLFLAIPVLSPAARDTLSGLFVSGQGAGGAAQSGAENGGEVDGGAGGGAGSGAAGSDDTRDGDGGAQYSDDPVSAEDSAESEAMMMEDTGGDLPTSGGAPESGGDLPASGGPPPETPREGLRLGERISLREARARVGKVFVPATIGEPDAVYAAEPKGVLLVYGARAGLPPLGDTGIGLILTELPGDAEPAYFPEEPPPRAGTEAVDVDGGPGYWAPAGTYSFSGRSEGLHANVLLWEREGRAIRLESSLPRGEAIRIAESTR